MESCVARILFSCYSIQGLSFWIFTKWNAADWHASIAATAHEATFSDKSMHRWDRTHIYEIAWAHILADFINKRTRTQFIVAFLRNEIHLSSDKMWSTGLHCNWLNGLFLYRLLSCILACRWFTTFIATSNACVLITNLRWQQNRNGKMSTMHARWIFILLRKHSLIGCIRWGKTSRFHKTFIPHSHSYYSLCHRAAVVKWTPTIRIAFAECHRYANLLWKIALKSHNSK